MSKTVILGWVIALLGFGGMVGIDFPMDAIETLLSSIWNDSAELAALIMGPVIVWFRTFSDSALVKGIMGWLGKRA